jgi:hypothetical protein
LFNLIYVVEGRILRILALADLKNIESPVFFISILRKTLKLFLSKIGGMNVAVSRE